MNYQEYISNLMDSFVTLAVKDVMAGLIKKSSFWALPFVNPVTQFVVKYVIEFAVKKAETQAFFWYIDMRVGNQSSDFEKASARNRLAQQSGTAQEKKDAEENLQKTFRAFASLRN